MTVLGIDVGGSTTKIVGMEDGRLCSMRCISADDPVTSLFGALGKYIYENGLVLSDISRIMITGVGSAWLDGQLYGIPTERVDEFGANALGAGYGSSLERMVVVSMGTGTSFIRVENGRYDHLGGLAIGGGTLQGLSGILFRTSDIRKVIAMAAEGSVADIDLQIRDISRMELPGLPLDVTASNFGKADPSARNEDVAAGIINMILQTIGSSANFIARNTGIGDFVCIGTMTQLPQCRPLFDRIEKLYGIRFHIPDHTEFRTAIGAALRGFGAGIPGLGQ